MKNFSNSIAMSTQLLDTYESKEHDIRFTKIKIWLMHLGENINGSSFDKEVVKKAIPSLANTPIMGSINYDYLGELDFEGHESEIEILEDGELKLINKTIPYGVIPENNNAKFEKRLGDDMIEREYLTVEGILWNKWEDAVELLHGKNGVTGQSMELADDYKGYFDGKVFHFTEFKFYGACLLGDEIRPAMNNSTVEITYSAKTKEFIDDKLGQFNAVQFSSDKGGKDLENKFQEEVTLDHDSGQEEEKDTEKKSEDFGLDLENVEEGLETIEKNKQDAKKQEQQQDEEEVEDESSEEEVKNDFPAAKDSVTVDEQTTEEIAQVRAKIAESQNDLPRPSEMIIVSGVEYSAKDIEELLGELNEYRAKYNALEQEVHNEKVDALVQQYSSDLTSDEVNKLKSNANELSIEDLENQIFAIIGKKKIQEKNNKFSTNSNDITLSRKGITVGITAEDKKVSTFDAILSELK